MTRTLVVVRLAVMSVGIAAGAGCQPAEQWRVQRVDPATPTDITYRFTDEDARQIFQDMAADVLSKPWIDNWLRDHGRRPIVFLATIRNNTEEYINAELITGKLEEALVNSGRVRVIAPREARQILRDERLDTRFKDPAGVKAVAKELNADLALMGSINDLKQRTTSGRTVINYYEARLELVDVETTEKVWINTREIKKVATR